MNLVVEFLRCELMVRSLGEKQENYSQSVVQVDTLFLLKVLLIGFT